MNSMDAEQLVKESMESGVEYIIQIEQNVGNLYDLIDSNQTQTALGSIEALLEGISWISNLANYMEEIIKESFDTTMLESIKIKLEELIEQKNLIEIKKIIESKIILELIKIKDILELKIRERVS